MVLIEGMTTRGGAGAGHLMVMGAPTPAQPVATPSAIVWSGHFTGRFLFFLN